MRRAKSGRFVKLLSSADWIVFQTLASMYDDTDAALHTSPAGSPRPSSSPRSSRAGSPTSRPCISSSPRPSHASRAVSPESRVVSRESLSSPAPSQPADSVETPRARVSGEFACFRRVMNLLSSSSAAAAEDSPQEVGSPRSSSAADDSDVPEVVSVGSDDEVSADDGTDRDLFDDDGFPKIDGDEDETSSSDVEFAPPPTPKSDPSQTRPPTSFTPAPFRTQARRRALKAICDEKKATTRWSGDILRRPSIEQHKGGRMQLRALASSGRKVHITSVVNPSPELKAAMFRVRDMIAKGDLTKEAAVKAFKS